MTDFEQARRMFRRKKAAQAWWIIVALIVLITAVGLFSDSGAARVEKIGATLECFWPHRWALSLATWVFPHGKRVVRRAAKENEICCRPLFTPQ